MKKRTTLAAAGAASILLLASLAFGVGKKRKTWVKEYIRKRISKGAFKIKNFPDPPKSLLRKHAFEKVDARGVPGYWLDKEKAQNGVLVYLHGGGYLFGPVELQWKYIARLSRLTNQAALVVDYRMAPEHPFPAALEDTVAFLSYLHKSGDLPPNYTLVGDSAGGGLAVATTYQLRNQQAPLPQKLLLLSPWLDINLTNPASQLTAPKDIILGFDSVQAAARKYVQNQDPRNPLISPVFSEVAGLPPTLLQIGTAEIFLWDSRSFVQKLTDAHVPVQFEEYEDMFHVFPLVPFLPQSRKALRSQVAFLTGKSAVTQTEKESVG
ncbi:alpha/beta hydrolase [Rufibacter latericius]|uniref:Alpha/beta hydrolase n=1 Tax=Rufibacter latericius TaxID=2487040 RepID=A0A3M9MAV3_9BACT|nr:alpha/beta hydrolase [Rufibacter latericius]RNI22699.1 alpha/beta hydrolase [Rufibacter latericius]